MPVPTDPTPNRLLGRVSVLTCIAAVALCARAEAILPAVAPVAEAAQRMGVREMFMHADWVVKGVMILLILCSVATWAILIEKSLLLARIRHHSENFLATFRTLRRIDQIAPLARQSSGTPLAGIWNAAQVEWDLFRNGPKGKSPTPHQVDRLLQRMALAAGIRQEEELVRLGNGMGLLATIGSTAPFIGLFGTVWGILHSFADIAAAKTTSLSVVAPGIAEALLATAIGLFAAIPAVMIYNLFARRISRMTGAFDNFVAEFTTLASRELEEAL